MAKYRNLTKEELETFEKEFVEYLVVNGITAEDWEEMKKEDNDKAQRITDLFSDVIMEGVLRKINFLEIYTRGYIQAIQCLPEKMIMVALSTKDKSIDMTVGEALQAGIENGDFELHRGEKGYNESREKELFKLTEKGYQVSDGKLFKQLILSTIRE